MPQSLKASIMGSSSFLTGAGAAVEAEAEGVSLLAFALPDERYRARSASRSLRSSSSQMARGPSVALPPALPSSSAPGAPPGKRWRSSSSYSAASRARSSSRSASTTEAGTRCHE